MKKVYLIIGIVVLTSLYQTNLFFNSIESYSETEKTSENNLPSATIYQQNNGIQIITPQNGDLIKGKTTIQWAFLFPYSLAQDINSNVFYSPDSGVNWIQLAYGTRDTSFEWDTVLYEEYGTEFKIKITATSKNWTEILEVISEGEFTINNRTNSNFPWYWYIIILAAIISISSVSSVLVYRYRIKRKYAFDFIKTTQTDELKNLSQKVVIGLDNIKDKGVPEIASSSGETISIENGSITQYFSSPFHNEFKSEIKGRTVMVLIEIAYQNPSETNPIKIAEGVGIPTSTLSKEIKKLITLNYIDYHISSQVLMDARYRNFKITKKGFEFLNLLNIILKDAIQKVKIRNGSSFAV